MTRAAWIPALAFGLLAASGTCAAAPGLRAGAAAVDITPVEFPLNMPGGFSENPADGAHDPLHARALVFDDGSTAAAIVIVDNLGVAAETADDARALAAPRCGIPAERIMIAATHTHSGPPSNAREGPAPAVAYRRRLVEGIAEAVVRAQAALRPAPVGYGADELPDEVFNRRWFLKPGAMPPNPFGTMDRVKTNPGTSPDILDRPAGPTDPELAVLDVQEARTHAPLALLACYSLHYVGGMPKGAISADYYGEFCRLMPSRVHGDTNFVAILANGTSGNINNIPFRVDRPPREPFEQIRIVAGKAADTAWRAWKGIGARRTDAKVGVIRQEIALRMRRPTPQQISDAKSVLAMTNPAETAKLPRLAAVYARRVVSLASAAETLTVPLQVLRIGDVAICAIPFETFVETGLDLKKRSPFPRTLVLGNANGCNGYLPTPEQHALGGYETWPGTSRVQEDASVLIADRLLAMLDELAKTDPPTRGTAP